MAFTDQKHQKTDKCQVWQLSSDTGNFPLDICSLTKDTTIPLMGVFEVVAIGLVVTLKLAKGPWQP